MAEPELKLDIPGAGASKTPGELLQSGTQWAPHGLIGGALLGGAKSLLSGGDFLSDTLSSALLGALGAGGTKAYLEADPFQRGGVTGQALQSAALGAGKSMLSGEDMSEAGISGLQSGLQSLLSGKGRFTPEDRKALIQQFTQSVLPTEKGWGRRGELMKRVGRALQSKDPRVAMPGLKRLTQVGNMDVSTAAKHAIERLMGGRFRAPEERTALGALGQRITGGLSEHAELTPILEKLRGLKEEYASGKLDPEGFAKRVGILTGRFGDQSEEANRARQAIQQVLAQQIPRQRMSSTEARAFSTPGMGELIQKAFERGRA